MKKIILIICLIISSSLVAQEIESKIFSTNTNRVYIGTNLAPIAVAALNGSNFQSEWKLMFKYRLTEKNHFLRASYSFINDRYNNSSSGYPNSDYYSLFSEPLNDSTYVDEGFRRNHNGSHMIKLGYEYDFMIGKRRSFSINLASDFIVGVHTGGLYAFSDTIIVREGPFDDVISYSDNEKLGGALISYGISPTIGFGFPIKKRFDLTVETAFDLTWSQENFLEIKNIQVSYRPNLVFSYRFDDRFRKKS